MPEFIYPFLLASFIFLPFLVGNLRLVWPCVDRGDGRPSGMMGGAPSGWVQWCWAGLQVSVGRLNRRCHVIMLMKQPDDEWTCATVELQLMQSA